jgi:hypothetical protein
MTLKPKIGFEICLAFFAAMSILWLMFSDPRIDAYADAVEPPSSIVQSLHDIAVTNVSLFETEAYECTDIDILVAIRNQGDSVEDVNVTAYANQTSESVFIETYLVSSIGPADEIAIPFVWIPMNVTGGGYTIVAEAAVLTDENNTLNNVGVSNLILVKADNTAPVIGAPVQDPIPDSVFEGMAVTVLANISDVGSGVLWAVIEWQTVNREGVVSDWSMHKMSNIGEHLYYWNLPAYPGGYNVSYRIVACDRAGHQTVRDNAGRYYVYHIIPEFQSILVLVSLMLFGILAASKSNHKHREASFRKHAN